MSLSGKPSPMGHQPRIGRPGAGAQSPGTAPESKPPAQYSSAVAGKAGTSAGSGGSEGNVKEPQAKPIIRNG